MAKWVLVLFIISPRGEYPDPQPFTMSQAECMRLSGSLASDGLLNGKRAECMPLEECQQRFPNRCEPIR